MTVAVGFSGTSSQTVGGAEQTLGNSGAAITTAGVWQLVLDVSLLANGTTPDILNIAIYLKPAAGGTERQVDSHSLVGAQSLPLWMSKPYPSPISVRFGVTQPTGGGTARALPYGVWQIA